MTTSTTTTNLPPIATPTATIDPNVEILAMRKLECDDFLNSTARQYEPGKIGKKLPDEFLVYGAYKSKITYFDRNKVS